MATVLEYANEVARMIGNAEANEVEKANGVKFAGVTVHQGVICPTVYVDEMYKRGMSVEDAARQVERLAEKSKTDGFDPEEFMDYEGYIKDKLRIRMYSKATKADVFRSAKAKGFDDLILVPYVNVNLGNNSGAIKVHKQHIKLWGVTQKEVIDTAIKNSKDDISTQSLMTFMESMMFGSRPTLEPVTTEIIDGPIVVTNTHTEHGASAILGLIPALKKKYPEGFYVIPSSVHETIVLPKGYGHDIKGLTEMVEEVNQSVLDPVDVLGHKAYEF